MSARALFTITLVAAGVLAPAANADAAKKRSGYPTVSKISPMRVSVGDVMTITGTGFVKGKAKNTVVFRRSGARSVFVKADGLTTTRLSLVVPSKLGDLLSRKSGAPVSTRFQIRILARRFGKSYTPLVKSPMVLPGASAEAGPAAAPKTTAAPAAPAAAAAAPVVARNDPPPPPPDCDGDGTPDATDNDDDNDILTDALELGIRTNRCLADTDGDGMQDGWEYKSAIDLNGESCPNPPSFEYPRPCAPALPFPGKRSYTNPLSPDKDADYDNDYLPAWWEHQAWLARADRNLTSLWYSDGLQASQDTNPTDGCRGLKEDAGTGQVELYPTNLKAKSSGGAETFRYRWLFAQPGYTLNTGQGSAVDQGCLSDDERDEDGDFLSNAVELVGVMSGPDLFEKIWEEPSFKTTWAGTDALDHDTDGDGIVDGIDDQDADDFWNVEEVSRGTWACRPPVTGDNPLPTAPETCVDTTVRTGLWTDPYNPCLPAIYARTCPRGFLVDSEIWRPFPDKTGTRPSKRWPLYGTANYYAGGAREELWNAVGAAEQKLPPEQPNDPGLNAEHPLPRPQ